MAASASSAAPPPILTVFYNTKCPVCDAGIRDQKRRLHDLLVSGVVVFEDINLRPDALYQFGAQLEDIRKKLHAIDANGQCLVGADVAIAMWRLTPGLKWLAAIAGNTISLPISRAAYNVLAHVLYRWNKRKGHW